MDHAVTYPVVSVRGKSYIQSDCSCGWQGKKQLVTDECPKTMAMSNYFDHINSEAEKLRKAERKALIKNVIRMKRVDKKTTREISVITGKSEAIIWGILAITPATRTVKSANSHTRRAGGAK